MTSKKKYVHVIPKGWNSMVVVYSGQLKIQNSSKVLEAGDSAVFRQDVLDDEALSFEAQSDDTKFIMLAGKPLNEPVVSHGPFVLTNEDELY